MPIPNKPILSIVFLNYNRLPETRYTVAHLLQLLAERTHPDIEIIAIDNGSGDGTGAYLQSQAPIVKSILLNSNTGIAGYNDGFKQAQGDYILVLDDDSHPVDNVTLDRMIHTFNYRPEIGVIACRIENTEGQTVRTWHLPDIEDDGEPTDSMAFVGCGFAIRRTLFEQIGWYPAEFFLYQNEMEVAIRVLEANYRILYDPHCHVIHRQSPIGRPNWRRVYYPTRNTIWIIRRYFPFPSAVYLIASRLVIGFIRALQTLEFGWYYRAIKEAFSYPVPRQVLPAASRRRLIPFWRQNSVLHHFLRRY